LSQKLNNNEKKIIHRNIHVDKRNNFLDMEVSKLLCQAMPKAWHEKLQEIVDEDFKYSECAEICLPYNMAKHKGINWPCYTWNSIGPIGIVQRKTKQNKQK
jgi:hypothetical protein